MEDQKLISITGKFTYVLFRSDQTMYTVAKFRTYDASEKTVTVTGSIPVPENDVLYTLSGSYVEHPRYGMQFQIAGMSVSLPSEKEGAVRYLSGASFPSFTITWKSSDTSIATVDSNGKVTGIKPGSVTITASINTGASATCNVIVTASNVLILPNHTKMIESEAFAGLTNVDIIVIPASVNSIADDAFAGSDVIIKAPSSSYAYRWAQSHGFQVQTP